MRKQGLPLYEKSKELIILKTICWTIVSNMSLRPQAGSAPSSIMHFKINQYIIARNFQPSSFLLLGIEFSEEASIRLAFLHASPCSSGEDAL